MRQDSQFDALLRELRELNATLRGQAEHDAPVRRRVFDERFLGGEVPIRRLVLDLTNSRDKELFKLPGTVLFADSDTTGEATIRFDSKEADPHPYRTNSGLELPYSQFFVSNDAQAGLVMNLWYGFDVRVIPPNQDISNIGTVSLVTAVTSITNPLTPPTIVPGLYYSRGSASNALGTIVAPASNTGGIEVEWMQGYTDGGTDDWRLMTKSSAPSAWNDATALSLIKTEKAIAQSRSVLIAQRFRIASGLGLYEQGEGATNNTGVQIKYRLL